MILNKDRILAARAQGVCFVCSLCQRWYEGEDRGLTDVVGDTRCSSMNGCCGPVWGGYFQEYTGPLGGYLHKYCYLCGKDATHVARANGFYVPIGLCKKHAIEIKRVTAREDPKGIVIVIAEDKADPDRFEVAV